MKVLFLSQRFVLPMDTGGKIRTGKILEQLSRHHEVTLVSNVEPIKDGQWFSKVESLCSKFVAVNWHETERYSATFFVRLFFQVFSRFPVTVLNSWSRKLQKAVEDQVECGEFDVAVCDFVQTALCFRQVSSVPIVLFQHNVESMIPKRHMDEAPNLLVRCFWWIQWRKMMSYEKKFCARFAHIIAVSEADRDVFRNLYGMLQCTAIATGVDTDYYQPWPARKSRRTIVFCGSMDWLPNQDGVLWFVKEVLPLVEQKVEKAEFVIVGRRPSESLRKAVSGDANVTFTGWVEDTRPYINDAAVFVVPLRIGGGTRLKIYEAMALSRPVVSTTIGAEGLPVEHEVNCFLENDAHSFAERVALLLVNQELGDRVGVAAREYVCANFSWERVSNQFIEILESVSQTSRGS